MCVYINASKNQAVCVYIQKRCTRRCSRRSAASIYSTAHTIMALRNRSTRSPRHRLSCRSFIKLSSTTTAATNAALCLTHPHAHNTVICSLVAIECQLTDSHSAAAAGSAWRRSLLHALSLCLAATLLLLLARAIGSARLASTVLVRHAIACV